MQRLSVLSGGCAQVLLLISQDVAFSYVYPFAMHLLMDLLTAVCGHNQVSQEYERAVSYKGGFGECSLVPVFGVQDYLKSLFFFFCQGASSGEKALTSGSLELMKKQVLAALNSCHVVDVTQEDASRIGKCKGAPIRSGVSSELATDLLPSSHVCTSSKYDGTTRVPARGTTVPPLYLHEVQRSSSQV